MLQAGDRAPDFTLPDHDGRPVRLAELLAQGPLILYFYPADFTPGCTSEACSIRDLHAELQAAGLRVVGVSPQDSATHERFRARHALPFALLADTDKRVIKSYGVDGPIGLGVRRATFLILPNGHIADAVLADLRITRHEQFIRGAIAAAAAPPD
jgi:thioredoxin-dependent peroxiredoxin